MTERNKDRELGQTMEAVAKRIERAVGLVAGQVRSLKAAVEHRTQSPT